MLIKRTLLKSPCHLPSVPFSCCCCCWSSWARFRIVEVACVGIIVSSLSAATATISGDLLGTRSYTKLPSAAFGGLGNETKSGSGILSLGVNISHSCGPLPGAPRRLAILVTLPRSLGFSKSNFLISACDFPLIRFVTEKRKRIRFALPDLFRDLHSCLTSRALMAYALCRAAFFGLTMLRQIARATRVMGLVCK